MGIFDPKIKAKKSKMKKDAIVELNSSNVNNTAERADGGATTVDNDREVGITFDSMLLVQLLLPLTLATLIWGRKWIFTRALFQLDRSCISLLCPSISRRERLRRWTSEQLSSNAGVQDAELRNLWLDGSHLCSLINSVVPGACANPHRHWRRPPTHAQALAYKYLGIIPVFTDAEFQTKTMTPCLEQSFQNYLTELQTSISKISQEQETLRRSRSHDYKARGMGLTTGEQHRKNYFYIYPTETNHRYDDVIITMKGPYNTYGSVILKSMNLVNSNYTGPYKSSMGKDIYQQYENVKKHQKSFLHSLSIDLTNIMNTGTRIVKENHDTLDFDIKIEKGRAKLAFISKNNGIHELCITTNGEHISGSPFNINIEKNSSGLLDSFIEVVNKHPYKTVNRKVIKKEIDFITEKVIVSNNCNLYDCPIMEESNSTLVDIPPNQTKKKLIRQEKLEIVDKDEESHVMSSVIDIVNIHENKTIDVNEISDYHIDESIASITDIAVELEQLVGGEIMAKDEHNLHENNERHSNSISQDIIVPKHKQLLPNKNELLNCSSDLSNIELEELEDTEISQPASLESSNKFKIIQRSNSKVNATVRTQSSKLSSNHSIYCSSEFSTNSIELEELEDNDISSDELLYFGQNFFPQVSLFTENSTSPKSIISVKERIAYYNKSPRDKEENTKNAFSVNIPVPMECSTFEKDHFACHTVKYSEITTNTSPIWKHIVQEENPNQSITLFITSTEIDKESNALNASTTSSCSSNYKEYSSSENSYVEQNNNSTSNSINIQMHNLEQYPQSYYNKSTEEFSEMFRKRKQFWDKKSVENSSSSESSLCNPIVSSYSFYNNRRLSSEKSLDGASNFYRSLDCFQSQQNIQEHPISNDELCKSTDDLAFPSVKERKLLFIKEMNNHWSKGQTSPINIKYHSNQKLNIPEKVIEQEIKEAEDFEMKACVVEKINKYNQATDIKSELKQTTLKHSNIESCPSPKRFSPVETRKLRTSETILSNKENFRKAQSYFKTLETGKKTAPTAEFNNNQIERRHSVDCENKLKKWEAEIRGGSLKLPRVSEKFPLNNIYKDVLGDRKNKSHFKGSANKDRIIETLYSMPDQVRQLDVECEFKEELFFGQKKFKDRPKLNSLFPVHY